MKRLSIVMTAIVLALGFSQFAHADYETRTQTLSNGRFNLIVSEIGPGPADLSISHLQLNNGFNILVLSGQNGTRINGLNTTFLALPTADLIVEGLPYSGGASVDIEDIMFVLPDDLIVRDIEDVDIDSVILTGSHADIIVEGPFDVDVNQSFSRDIKIGMDYAPKHIDVVNSAFSRNVWVKGRFTNVTNIGIGNDLYVYGTHGADTIKLDNVRSRNGSAPFPPFKISLGNKNDSISFRNCRAAFIDVHGGWGWDTTHNLGGNNFGIGTFNTTSVESFK